MPQRQTQPPTANAVLNGKRVCPTANVRPNGKRGALLDFSMEMHESQIRTWLCSKTTLPGCLQFSIGFNTVLQLFVIFERGNLPQCYESYSIAIVYCNLLTITNTGRVDVDVWSNFIWHATAHLKPGSEMGSASYDMCTKST